MGNMSRQKNSLMNRPFQTQDELEAFLMEFGFLSRIGEGPRKLEEIKSFYERDMKSRTGLASQETFNSFRRDRINEQYPALLQVFRLLVSKIGRFRDERVPEAYVFSMIRRRMRGHVDRERGDGENPITTACIDVLLFKYFDYYIGPPFAKRSKEGEQTEDRATFLKKRREEEAQLLKWLENKKPSEFKRFNALTNEMKEIRDIHRPITTADADTISRFIELRRERRSILKLARDNQ